MAKLQAELIRTLLEFISQPQADENAFNSLALSLFAHQVQYNTAYGRFCRLRGRTPATVRNWQDIPAVPVNSFKEFTLSCEPEDSCERGFTTSGTTREVKGQHFHVDLQVWDASMRRHFADCVSPLPIRMGILFPTEAELPNSSLARYLQLALQDHGLPGSAHLMSTESVGMTDVQLMVQSAQALLFCSAGIWLSSIFCLRARLCVDMFISTCCACM